MASRADEMEGMLRHMMAEPGERLDAFEGTDGYYKFYLEIGQGNWETLNAHELVWESFVGPIPDGYRVSHKDGDRSNNALYNLELVPLRYRVPPPAHSNIKGSPERGALGVSSGASPI